MQCLPYLRNVIGTFLWLLFLERRSSSLYITTLFQSSYRSESSLPSCNIFLITWYLVALKEKEGQLTTIFRNAQIQKEDLKYLKKLHFNGPSTLPTQPLHMQVRHTELPPLHSHMNKVMEKTYYRLSPLWALGVVWSVHKKQSSVQTLVVLIILADIMGG